MANIISKIAVKLSRCYWKQRLAFTSKTALKNIIVFESAPDLSDNSKAVFDEFLAQGFNKHYKLVYLLFDSDKIRKSSHKNVYFIPFWEYRAKYYSMKAKVKISCNHFLEKENNNQFSIYLSHGTPLKSVRKHYTLPNSYDYSVAPSKKTVHLYSYELNYDESRIVPLGFPRNDVLTQSQVDIHNALGTSCKKIIVWYPTFRQHRTVEYTVNRNALPIIHNAKAAKALNNIAAKQDILIVLKPHFAQDLKYVKKLQLSNIRFIDDNFFTEHNLTSYAFVGACDALITDYSSIYFDYTLCNKPIAAIWEDIQDYKRSPGLVSEYEYLMKGAEKIYTLDEFIGFIRRIGEGVDLLKTERQEIRDYANISTDGNNSKRVVEFIIQKAKL